LVIVTRRDAPGAGPGAGEVTASPTLDVSWPNMSALLVDSCAEATIAVKASATAVKLLVNLNIGLRRNGALMHIKQPVILPDGNVDREPFVVAASIHCVAQDEKFSIFATFKIPVSWGDSKSIKNTYLPMRLLILPM
jgi:hypothetical protein